MPIAAAALLALTGCVHEPVVGYGRDDGGTALVCGSAEPGESKLVGDAFEVLDRPVELVGVDLVDADGLRLDGVWFTPPGEGIGLVAFPPPADIPWHPDEAIGATVPAGTTQLFAVQVTRTGDGDGSASALELTFEVDGREEQAVGTLAIELRSSCADEEPEVREPGPGTVG